MAVCVRHVNVVQGLGVVATTSGETDNKKLT